MPEKSDKEELLGLFYKLRALSDAELAVLTAWRDVEQFCADHKATLVEVSMLDEWFDVSARAIDTLKWLATSIGNEHVDKAEYWRKWQKSLGRAVADHIGETLDILDGVPRF